jgi:predicted ATPase/uncharacterized protein HemY
MTGVKPVSALSRLTAELDGKPDPLLPAHEVNAKIPMAIAALLLKALALEPEQRFASASEMRSALTVAIDESATEIVLDQASLPIRHTISTAPHNLPAQLTTLVGRESEINAIRQRMQREDVRLLTLTGPGGIGKTRLGVEVAATLLQDFPDGIFFVSLAPIRDPGLVLSTIAHTLGVKESGGLPPLQSLLDYLREKQLLLLLDNFEQVVAAAPLVTDLLAACPRLKVLVTSREVLRLRGEQEFPVPALTLPDPRRTPPLETLSQYEAVKLFIQRALAAKPNLIINNENAPAVVEICFRLDGLPLAIELAAARVKLLSLQELLQRLEDRFKLLRGGARDLPARHQTLRRTVAWSYDLLDEAEKVLFRRLAVFIGGCTLEAAEAVCAPADDEHIAALAIDVLDGLASLIDKSLLRQEEGADDEPRFVMLATIHDHAAERLAEGEEAGSLHRRHTVYYLSLAEQAEPELKGPKQIRWLSQLELEHDNLRAALHWAREHGETGVSLRLGKALWQFWEVHGHISEGRRHLADMLSQSSTSSPATRAKALIGANSLARNQGDYVAATSFLKESLVLFQELGDKHGIAFTLGNLGLLAKYEGDYEQASALCETSLALFRELGDRDRIAVALNHLGVIAHDQGNYERAKLLYGESLALKRELGDKGGVAYALHNLAFIAYEQAEYELAKTLYEESLSLKQELGHKYAIAKTLGNLGLVAREQGDYGQAVLLHEKALALEQEVGDRPGIAYSLHNLGDVARDQGDDKRAAQLYEEGLTLHQQVGNKRGVAHSLSGLGDVAHRQGDYKQASELGKESLTLFRELGDKRGIAYSLDSLGSIAREQSKYEQAAVLYRESLRLFQEMNDRLGIAKSLYNLGIAAQNQDKYELATSLLSAAEALRQVIGVPMARANQADYERALAAVQHGLGEEAFAAAWDGGQTMTLEQAVEYALVKQ